MQSDDRTFARHWEELVALASNESDSEKLSLLMHAILELLEQHQHKPKRKAAAA